MLALPHAVPPSPDLLSHALGNVCQRCRKAIERSSKHDAHIIRVGRISEPLKNRRCGLKAPLHDVDVTGTREASDKLGQKRRPLVWEVRAGDKRQAFRELPGAKRVQLQRNPVSKVSAIVSPRRGGQTIDTRLPVAARVQALQKWL